MKCVGPTLSNQQIKKLHSELQFSPSIDELAARLDLAGSSSRLKIFWLLNTCKELCVCDLAEILGASVSNVSQHLGKLKAYNLVKNRREGTTLYYSLSAEDFTRRLQKAFLRDLEV